MTHDEKRFLRRELINFCLQKGMRNIDTITAIVRLWERKQYRRKLNLYKVK